MEGRAGADHHGEMLKNGGEREKNGNIVNIVLVFHMKKGSKDRATVKSLLPRLENMYIMAALKSIDF